MVKRIQLITIISICLTVFSVQGFGQNNDVNPNMVGINTIVIDPGHGGKDPGCHGVNTNEKSVALAIGLKLGEYIKKQFPKVNVIYTRSTDVFIELDERAQIANRNHADLFICIHANSAAPEAYGVETYVLGLHRTEAQQKVAERENATIYLEDDNGEKYKNFDISPDAIIARQLQLNVFLDQSIDFADNIQKYFNQLGRHDRGVKQAGFLVLYKTTMPSVLIETGFLTNAQEERFLKDPEQQAKMANAIFKAVVDFKSQIDGVNYQAQIQAENKLVFEEKKLDTNAVYFKVQIETSSTPVSLSDPRFKNNLISEYQQDKLYKYTVGNYKNDYSAANDLKNKMRKDGFNFAFVVAFQGSERISLEKAIKLATK
ncbi:MAG: N-acetylmuramoyl-L-alanine amidase [Crocinitomicaceae bacterium]